MTALKCTGCVISDGAAAVFLSRTLTHVMGRCDTKHSFLSHSLSHRVALGSDYSHVIVGGRLLLCGLKFECVGSHDELVLVLAPADVHVVDDVMAYRRHVLAVGGRGQLLSYGNNDAGQLCLGDRLDRQQLTVVSLDFRVRAVAVGGTIRCCCRSTDGGCWVLPRYAAAV